jgi:hypothetical protein
LDQPAVKFDERRVGQVLELSMDIAL